MSNKNPDAHDDWGTPRVALDVLYNNTYTPSKIYDPFCGDGRIVKYYEDAGFESVGTDIKTGTDFFAQDYSFWKNLREEEVVLISNPPYSLSTKILEKLFDLSDKGIEMYFALLMPLRTFDTPRRFNCFRHLRPRMIVPSKRFQYENMNGESNDRINFLTCWFTNIPSVGYFPTSVVEYVEVPDGK